MSSIKTPVRVSAENHLYISDAAGYKLFHAALLTEPKQVVEAAQLINDSAALAQKVAALRKALETYMSAIGQGYEAHGLPFDEQQKEADRMAREVLEATK